MSINLMSLSKKNSSKSRRPLSWFLLSLFLSTRLVAGAPAYFDGQPEGSIVDVDILYGEHAEVYDFENG